MTGTISKRDAFRMTDRQVKAGREMWKRTETMGRLATSSMDAEAMAPRTWILWANQKGEEIYTIECELYVQGRFSNPGEAVAMLVGMCPKCGENFTVREDNKAMQIDWVEFRYAPKHIQINYRHRMERELWKPWSASDKVPVISCPERWLCDYCKGWCVRVTDGVAITDMTGATQLYISGRPTIIGESGNGESGNKGDAQDL
jgi:hypothetical protein